MSPRLISLILRYVTINDSIFFYPVGLREQNKFFLDLLPKLEAALAFVKEFIAPYERMLQECKAHAVWCEYERTTLLNLRKRKMNQKKDIRRKQQRQVTIDTMLCNIKTLSVFKTSLKT
jgi:hypothetical protein